MTRTKYKEAIGLKVIKGRQSIGKKPEKTKLKHLYINEIKSIREIAETLGCSKDMVYRALVEYEIGRRAQSSIKKLADYSIENLKTDVKNKGIRGLARELGVSEGAIRYHLRKLDGV